jgi:hypothetical protein
MVLKNYQKDAEETKNVLEILKSKTNMHDFYAQGPHVA